MITHTMRKASIRYWLSSTQETSDSDAITIAAAYSTAGAPLSSREKNAQNNLVKYFKSIGVWTGFDMLQVEYGGVIIDWKNLARSIQKISAPVSAPYMGLYFNGTSSYVKTGFNPATNGVNYKLNDASLFVYISKPPYPGAAPVEMGCSTTPFAQINISSAFFVLNSAAPATFTIAPASRWGLFSVDRNASNSVISYRNGVQIDAQTTASTSIPNAEIFWGARSNSGAAAGFSSSVSKIIAAGKSMRALQPAIAAGIQTYISQSYPLLDFSGAWQFDKDGQSNANGKASTTLMAADLIPDIATNFEFIGNPPNTQFTDGAWEVQQIGRLSANNIGVERRLLRLLSIGYSGKHLYLINSGQDGTSLQVSWNPTVFGTAYQNSKIKYDFAKVKRPEAVTANFVLWIQGEADAGNPAWYAEYEYRLIEMIQRKRAEFNLPNLIYILVSLSNTQTDVDSIGRTAVNTAMANVAASLPNVYYISQNSASDGTHYTAPGFDQMAPLIYNLITSL